MPDLLLDRLQSSLGAAYTLHRELGGGGMSRVFVARDEALGRDVVVKVLAPELAAWLSAERFAREIRLAASLQQANIVPVLSAGTLGELPYYTMPYVEGESLRHRLAHGPLGVGEAVAVLRDVARALAYAHARDIVHRDIKPDNVLLSGGTAVVTDFGIAKALGAARAGGDRPAPTGALTGLGTALGTPAYMAPEQATADPDADHRVDVYAFGCLAYELLAGVPPFHGQPAHRLLLAHLNETPKPLASLRPDVPPALVTLVARCLEKEPDRRPRQIAEILPALDAISTGGAAAAPAFLLGGTAAFRRALALYALAFVAVALLARAAIAGIGLPDWVFPGALAAMGLGFPILLFTGYAQRVARRASAMTPTYTPNGSPATAHGTVAQLALKASPHLSWRRAARAGVLALGAFAVAVAAYMAMRALGIGPAGSLLAAGRLDARDSVLVADFASRGDTTLGRVVAEAVEADLGQSTAISVVPDARVADALTRMQRPPGTRLAFPVARDLARREGFEAVVDGEVTALGAGFVVVLRLVTADSGRELVSYRAAADSPKELIATVGTLTRKLRGKVGESLKDVQDSPPLERVTTASLEALRVYTAAYAANVARDYEAAIRLAREAVAIDTGFAMGWRLLSTALRNAGAPVSSSDSAITRAFRTRDRLTETERLFTEGTYYSARDRRKAAAAYEAVRARGDTGRVAINLGNLYFSLRQHAKAESLYRAAMRLNGTGSNGWVFVTTGLLEQGRVGEAEAHLREWDRLVPDSPNPELARLNLLAVRGRYDEHRRLADSLRRSPVRRVRAAGIGGLRWSAMVHGQFRAAQQLRAEEVAARPAEAALARRDLVVDSALLARVDAWFLGRSERALRRLDATLAAVPLAGIPEADRPEPYGEAAIAYALAGRPDRARAVLDDMLKLRDTSLARSFPFQPTARLVRGEIALAEGKPAAALAEFRQMDSLPDGPGGVPSYFQHVLLARAFDAADQPDSAIAYFERYLTVPSGARPDDVYFLAGTHKRLGELYEARGDRARAASAYARFVELWKDADPEVQPQVRAARERLARVGDPERR